MRTLMTPEELAQLQLEIEQLEKKNEEAEKDFWKQSAELDAALEKVRNFGSIFRCPRCGK